MGASPPALSPTGTTGFNRTSYMDTIEAPTFQGTTLLKTIRTYPGQLMNQGTVRKYGRTLGNVLSQGVDGSSLTPSDPSATPVSITPVHRYLDCEWSEAEKVQVDFDLSNGLAPILESGMSETLDAAAYAAVPALTQNFSQAAMDATFWSQLVGRVMQNTNGAYGPGQPEGKGIMACFTPTQYPNLRSIPEFNNADIRGDSENPSVSGIFLRGGGMQVQFSTVVVQDANGWHCPVYTRDTFIVGWNLRTHAFEEQTSLIFRLVVSANMGVSVLHDLRGIDARLTASAL